MAISPRFSLPVLQLLDNPAVLELRFQTNEENSGDIFEPRDDAINYQLSFPLYWQIAIERKNIVATRKKVSDRILSCTMQNPHQYDINKQHMLFKPQVQKTCTSAH